MTRRALPLASLVTVTAGLALEALAFALALTIDTGTDLDSTRYQIENKADFSAYVLVFLALALAVSARDAVFVGRAALGIAWAASVAAALAFSIVGVVLAYRGTGFAIVHAYAWVSLARTTGFAALALGVLAPAIARRKGLALAVALGLAAVGTAVFSLTRGAGEPTFSLATVLAVLAAAATFPAAASPPASAVSGSTTGPFS